MAVLDDQISGMQEILIPNLTVAEATQCICSSYCSLLPCASIWSRMFRFQRPESSWSGRRSVELGCSMNAPWRNAGGVWRSRGIRRSSAGLRWRRRGGSSSRRKGSAELMRNLHKFHRDQFHSSQIVFFMVKKGQDSSQVLNKTLLWCT